MELSLPPAEEILGVSARKMEHTPQDPRWHGEGDVFTHTKLVCERLRELPSFQKADEETKLTLYLAAVLHDIGKISATRMEDGHWVSPGHSRIGAQMARQLLWQEMGYCGTVEKQRIRERVCSLIRWHSLPPHAITEPRGELTLRRIAANGVLIPGFTVEQLCILAEADARGRICTDRDGLLERIWLCRELAKEMGCFTGPYPFQSEFTQYACLAGRNVQPDQLLYDDTWGEVILMSGLPGTGKDTWIRERYPALPVVSLDDIRTEQAVSPLENQSRVVEAARERAKELLRRKQPFVWNATNITSVTRQKQVELFAAYGASVRIVYLETEWEEQMRRNGARQAAVAEAAICHMLEKMSPPERQEAHQVEWHCV